MAAKTDKKAQVILKQDTDKERLFGENKENLKYIAEKLKVRIDINDQTVNIHNGTYKQCQAAKKIIETLEEVANEGGKIANDLIDRQIARYYENTSDPNQKKITQGFNGASLVTKNKEITPRTENQKKYLEGIINHTVTFGIGEAGTGKTFLAVAAAIDAYERGECKKIILCRPAVEAGENLGFLPGDSMEKVDPYFRPIYDALEELLGRDKWKNMVEKGTIEIAPLAFMRGRSLKNSFVILDEAQNTTQEQMRMFLTRLHTGSKMVINGDISQNDLPKDKKSGLEQALAAQADTDGVFIQRFTIKDIQRHEMVSKMLEGYQRLKKREEAKPDTAPPKHEP